MVSLAIMGQNKQNHRNNPQGDDQCPIYRVFVGHFSTLSFMGEEHY